MQSIVQQRGAVNFPSFNGDRIHMLTIDRDKPLPEVAKRWQQTIDDMLHGIDHDGPVYLMVDQKEVKANQLHRRGGLHIDGFWVPGTIITGGRYPEKYGTNAGGYDSGPKYSTMQAAGGHHIFEVPTSGHKTSVQIREDQQTRIKQIKRKQKIDERLSHIPKKNAGSVDEWRTEPAWNDPINDEKLWPNETIILASNVPACRALVGDWGGIIGKGGDVTHLDLSHMREIQMQAGIAYAGNVTFVHESLPVLHDCQRTVVRINVPGHVLH